MSNVYPGDTWSDVVDQARDIDDLERGEVLLTATLAAALAMSPDSLHERRLGDYPPGVPKKALVRTAARLLLDRTAVPRTGRSYARRSLAWTLLLRLPQQGVVTDAAPQGEIVQSVENCRRALTELGDHGDQIDHAIVSIQLARYLRRSNQTIAAVDALDLDPLTVAEVNEETTAPLILRDAPFLSGIFVDKVRFKFAEIRYEAYKDLNRLDGSLSQIQTAREIALRYEQTLPDDLARTWLLEGHLCRRSRDVPRMLQVEHESRALITRHPDSSVVWRSHSAQASSNAALFQDFSRAQALRHERLRNRLQVDLGRVVGERPSIAELMECVADYRRLDSKSGITWLGNIASDIAGGYARSGAAVSDPEARLYAEGLLDVVELAWDGFATNGTYSVLSLRARLALMSGDASSDQSTADLITVSRHAFRFMTAQNALAAAVRLGVAGSAEVRVRLDERLAEFDASSAYVAHAKTVGLSAEWWWRAAVADVVGIEWDRVEGEALTAARMLRLEGVSVAPESEATAWMAAARAGAEVGSADRGERLRRLLLGIGCVTELMLTIATTVDRRRMADKFAVLFTDAADLAVELGDHRAADLLMEAGRRDRVGLLLAELARNPDIDTHIRAAALAVQDSGSATVDSSNVGHTDEDTESEGDDENGVRGRSAVIAVDRAVALKAAESVLGPLSALADPRHLGTVTAASVLDRRGERATVTAILQLLPLTPTQDCGPGRVPVLRRVTVGAPGKPLQEFTDRVEIPRKYLDFKPGDDGTFVSRPRYTPLLVPDVLTELLRSTDPSAPVRLMIVPTGFFHIPFDALPVTAGTHVVDHALVSIHGSLTSALSLMELEEQRSPTPALAVYDDGLAYAGPELEALLASLVGVRRVEFHQDLDVEMAVQGAQPHSLLAMAVHGSADDHGWGQAKKLRDAAGNAVWVTAAQALTWTVPRLCVLASCNTPITAPDGVEVGGFPLALMLRGASTVIGGLYSIDDQATSLIMIAFWRHLAAGESALHALRHAKIDYLHSYPDHRRIWPEYWAGLTVYGAPNT